MTQSEILRQLREENKYTQKYVAEKLGIQAGTYSTYETGRCEPNNEQTIALANLYGVTVDYLLGIEKSTSSLFDEVLRQLRTLQKDDYEKMLEYAEFLKWKKGH